MCKIQKQGLSVINSAELLKLEMGKHKAFLTKVENAKTFSGLEKGVKRRLDVSDRIDLDECSEREKLDEAKSMVFEEFLYTVDRLDDLTSNIDCLLNICIDMKSNLSNSVDRRLVSISDKLYSCCTYNDLIKDIDTIIKNTNDILKV